MRWLVVLTVAEIVLVLVVLVVYLVAIRRRLELVTETLAKITFGVRAIESQTASIGASVTRLNRELQAIAGALGPLAEKADRLAARPRRP
ncbi:MAG: hypothetical protein M3N51_06585 [Actinomycetota bacterium]|nr:hypothetical protein [Actinomycetota bacterium]